MMGSLRVTVSFGGEPDNPIYFYSFVDAWDWAYGWMVTNDMDESDLDRFAHIEKIDKSGPEKKKWSDFPQNKKSREENIKCWIEERGDQ